jgi:hypothetical protein
VCVRLGGLWRSKNVVETISDSADDSVRKGIISLAEQNEAWPPKPTEPGVVTQQNDLFMVSSSPLGILSCVLSLLLLGTHIIFLIYLYQMNLQEKINFVIFHSDVVGMLRGAEIIGVPVALFLGFVSWQTKIGKAGLFLAGTLILASVYVYLFGLPKEPKGPWL